MIGLFGETVPKTAGKELNYMVILSMLVFLFSYSSRMLLITLLPCVYSAENFRALCTGSQVDFALQ